VKEIRSPFDGRLFRPEPEPVSRGIGVSAETLKLIRSALHGVVNEEGGTMWYHRLKDVNIAGKTGTAQVKRLSAERVYEECTALPFTERRHAWFVGYAPSEAPEIAVAVLAEHACHGNVGAGPVAAEVFRAYFEKKQRKANQNTTTWNESVNGAVVEVN
jgi:penicillin-binding protein 2